MKVIFESCHFFLQYHGTVTPLLKVSYVAELIINIVTAEHLYLKNPRWEHMKKMKDEIQTFGSSSEQISELDATSFSLQFFERSKSFEALKVALTAMISLYVQRREWMIQAMSYTLLYTHSG